MLLQRSEVEINTCCHEKEPHKNHTDNVINTVFSRLSLTDPSSFVIFDETDPQFGHHEHSTTLRCYLKLRRIWGPSTEGFQFIPEAVNADDTNAERASKRREMEIYNMIQRCRNTKGLPLSGKYSESQSLVWKLPYWAELQHPSKSTQRSLKCIPQFHYNSDEEIKMEKIHHK